MSPVYSIRLFGFILIWILVGGGSRPVNSHGAHGHVEGESEEKDKKDPLDKYATEWEGHLEHGASCTDPALLEETQINTLLTPEQKITELNAKSCNFAKFLTCYTSSNKTVSETAVIGEGICGCHDSTGGNPFGVLNLDGVCRIPAGKDFQSSCGPHRQNRQLYTGATLEASCTDNSECRPDSKHTGKRCYCKISFKWKDGACNSSPGISPELVLVVGILIRLFLNVVD